MKQHDNKMVYVPIIVTSNEDGYLARCPDIQSAFAEGDTIEEAIFNCIDVIRMIADYRKERNEPLGINEVELTPDMQISFTMPLGIHA